ncbi:MAG TPA: hypothetical protein VLB11_02245 [Methyloceanibacter sp.]|nr:hypothetical protein [Methyloceanibacter sp.]
MLLHAMFPTEPFNALVRSGKAGEILQKIMEDIKPEAVYFTEEDGMRSALLVVDLVTASDVPKIAEPFFLNFDAECRLRIVMSPEDLKNAGLDALGKKWG